MINQLELLIWGRLFSLPIEYDCYPGESVTRSQISAIKRFAKHTEWIDHSKSLVEDYCREQVAEDENNQNKNNIFSYVIPDNLFVKRERKRPRVALLCKYRYDPEHGLMIVFSADGTAIVGHQDMII